MTITAFTRYLSKTRVALNLSLRQVLFAGAGLGILLPAVVMSYVQFSTRLDTEIDVRVRVPMQQYAQMLAQGLSAAIWNLDTNSAKQLVEAVMRNPDVVLVEVTDENRQRFVEQGRLVAKGEAVLQAQRDIVYNGAEVGQLRLVLSTERVKQMVVSDLLKFAVALLAQVFFSFGLIWLLLDQRLLRPLQQLQAGAQRLARGEMQHPFQWSRRDEIGKLAQDLDAMRSHIAELISERDQKNVALVSELNAKQRIESQILELNATLEARVDARTRELNEAMTHLQVTQEELVRSEKMSALGALVAGIAHELNTPIGNSLTVASTLAAQTQQFAKEVGTGLTRSRLDQYVANAHEGADILTRSLHHAADLVSSFKQVAVDQTSLNRREFALQQTIHDILSTLGPTLRKAKCGVDVDIAEDLSMDSYPGPLGQVITNLVNNALIHAFDQKLGGHIAIASKPLGKNKLELTVADDGCGITAGNIGKIFDPFFTTKLGHGGSGLGLHIVYNLVTASLGGSIRVESQPGQGTKFILVLPRVAK